MTPNMPVVYLPGIDGTGRLLYRQERLNAEHPVRCVSYPQDDKHTYADLVKLGIRALEETGPCAVIAESFGGAVAIMVALERPDLVKRLVLVNTFAYFPRRLFIDVAGLLGPWLPNRPASTATRLIRGLFCFGPNVPKADQTAWWELTADVPMRAYGHRCRLLRDVDLRPRLREVQAPAVVFVSPNDYIVPVPAGRALAKQLPRAKLLTPIAAGHTALADPRIDVAAWLKDDRLWLEASRGPS
jgi:pimeloyl-ACP methyl ester carboxylesterase